MKKKECKHKNRKLLYTTEEHEDERWTCLDCGHMWWREGSDY